MAGKVLAEWKASGAGLCGCALGLIGGGCFGCYVSGHGHGREKRAEVRFEQGVRLVCRWLVKIGL